MWLQAAQHGIGFLNKRREAKNRAAWDRYNNTMAGLQAGQAQNSITENVVAERDAHASKKLLIATSRLKTAAKVRAGAAAAGVSGGSVEQTLFDVGRNAGNALYAEEARFGAALLVSDQQRKNVSMQRQMAIKPVTRMPSIAQAIGGGMLSIAADRAEDNTPQSRGTNMEAGQLPQTMTDGWSKFKDMLMI